jgi:hypothetical protein
MMTFNCQRYDRYDPPGRAGRSWSLITRMRLESDQASERARATLARFTDSIETLIAAAVAATLASGELVADAPADDIGVQRIAIVDSAGSITQDSGSFDRRARPYTAFLHIVCHAYGHRSAALATGG